MNLGVTDSNELDSLIKKAMFSCAERKILALDGGKFDSKSFVKVCDVKDLDMIITDSEPREQWKSYCSENGVEIVF